MGSVEKLTDKSNIQLEKEYFELMSNNTILINHHYEWKEKGDLIEKFSLYENYTPVKTSTSTDIII